MAGDFPVTILRANNVAGLFSGEGWVKVPYLADTKIHVTYQNIKVNTDYKLIDGYFETVYNAKDGNIVSVDTALADVAALIKDVSELVKKVEDLLFKRKAFIDNYSGSDADKQQAVPLKENEDLVYKTVIQSSLLTQAEKDTLKQENTTVDDALGCIGNPTGGIKKGADDDEPTTCIQTYASATHLDKYKDLIQQRADAEILFSGDFFKIADKLDDKNTIDKYLDSDQKLSFVTPDGQIIKLPKDAEVSFGNYLINSGTNLSSSRSKDALGYLLAFKIDQKTYISNFSKGEFLGYFNHDSHDKNTKDLYGQIDKANIIAGIEYTQCQLLLEYGPYKEAIIDNFDKAEQITFIDGNFEVLGSEQVGNQDCILCSIPNDKKPKPVNDLLTELPSHPDGGGNVSSLASAVGDQDMQNFICADDRFKIIKNIANSGSNDGKSIIELFRTTPDNQVQTLIKLLFTDNSGLLRNLYSSIDDNNIDQYFAEFGKLFKRFLGNDGFRSIASVLDEDEKNVTSQFIVGKSCYFFHELAKNGIFAFPKSVLNSIGGCNIGFQMSNPLPILSYAINDDGSFTITYISDHNGTEDDMVNVTIKPFDIYKIYQNINGVTIAEYLPGYNILWILKNLSNEAKMLSLNTTTIIITPFIPPAAGVSLLAHGIWTGINVMVVAGNNYIIYNADELNKTKEGRDFVSAWNKVNLCLSVADGAVFFYGIGKNWSAFVAAFYELKNSYKIWKATRLTQIWSTNPELANKLESFDSENGAIATLDNLKNDYEKQYPSQANIDPEALNNNTTTANAANSALQVITTNDELIAFLDGVTENTKVTELEARGIKAVFRGTTRSIEDGSLFEGNSNAQENGISTSTDPIKATIFAIESATEYGANKGVVMMGLTEDLRGLTLQSPNRRIDKELEIVFNTPAQNFANTAKIEISVDKARELIKEFYGVELPSRIDRDLANELLPQIKPSTLEQSEKFYQYALKYNKQ